MVCMCVLVYSYFVKNPLIRSWLTTHLFMMGVLQAPPTADPEWPNVGAPGPSRLPVPPRPLASLKVFFVFE
jgi:hypothetical protein